MLTLRGLVSKRGWPISESWVDDWPKDARGAKQDQVEKRRLLRLQTLDLDEVRSILAIGVGYSESRSSAVAVGVPMLPNGQRLGDTLLVAEENRAFPYVAGLFFYREGPAVMSLMRSLPGPPDLVVSYGQGIAHPRGFGLASHLGVLAGVPSIGVTRKRLWGSAAEPGLDSTEPLPMVDRAGKEIGVTQRLLPDCEQVFASPGHLTDVETVRAAMARWTAVQGCLPMALCVAQEEANRRAMGRTSQQTRRSNRRRNR